MLASLGALVCALHVGCAFTGAQTFYGVSNNDQNFAEVDFVLVEKERVSKIQGVPFVAFGSGRLPVEYGPERDSFQRASIGQKVRYPFYFWKRRLAVYLEVGGLLTYYSGGTISEPWDLEVTGGVGSSLNLGKGWGVDLGARVVQPTNNGNGHKDTEMVHSPHGTRGEFVFGLKKDF
ncbi:MAG: hypothetical protein ACYTF8_07100 [Planctomycetota bacterium]|jgi:hypothetical protein